MTVKLTLACMENDRTQRVLDGSITVPGFTIESVHADPQEIFRRALREQAYDLSELSMGSHITTTALRENHYIAVPVFLSRSFRHSCIYVRSDKGIKRPEDLRGKRIGIADYQQTAILWLRGMLHEQYGVAAHEVSWRTGGMEQAGAPVRLALDLPKNLDVQRIGDADTLNGLLVSGGIDAIMSPNPPSSFIKGDGAVVRLFPDYPKAEQDYYKQTGYFPIMHVLTVRKTIADAHPDLPLKLFEAFAKAKAASLRDLTQSGVLKVMLPWLVSQFAETKKLMGQNPWKYGFKENEKEVRAMCRYAHTDGLAPRMVEPSELFHPSTLAAADAA